MLVSILLELEILGFLTLFFISLLKYLLLPEWSLFLLVRKRIEEKIRSP